MMPLPAPARIALCGLAAAAAGAVLALCFRAYLDPGLAVALATARFLCQ
jgi:hypothetical protein